MLKFIIAMRLSNGWVFSIVVPLALLHGAPSGAKPSSLADLLWVLQLESQENQQGKDWALHPW